MQTVGGVRSSVVHRCGQVLGRLIGFPGNGCSISWAVGLLVVCLLGRNLIRVENGLSCVVNSLFSTCIRLGSVANRVATHMSSRVLVGVAFTHMITLRNAVQTAVRKSWVFSATPSVCNAAVPHDLNTLHFATSAAHTATYACEYQVENFRRR